ncbi:MAG TPA: radical SAM protein [Deltaproteobacteria bacterium]|nr:radical SAM protein [Deltaproteobacteria bacterium]
MFSILRGQASMARPWFFTSAVHPRVRLDQKGLASYNRSMHTPEQLVIRPPSEARSLLVRTVRGCNWNRCLFCGIYDLFGTPHSMRELDDVLKDIDSLREIHRDVFTTAFIGDADPLSLPTEFLVEVLTHLRKTFPSLKRVTAYGRASSLWKKSPQELKDISAAGLDRVHVGMESGSDLVLRFQKKGTSARQLIEAGQNTMVSGMELSYYFLLGLGGREMWKDHVAGSITVINEVAPHFVRVRRLWIHPASRLMEKVTTGEFTEQTPEGTVIELRDLLAGLNADRTYFTCDHANNYLQVAGLLGTDRQKMLEEITSFLALPSDRREAYYRSIPSVI